MKKILLIIGSILFIGIILGINHSGNATKQKPTLITTPTIIGSPKPQTLEEKISQELSFAKSKKIEVNTASDIKSEESLPGKKEIVITINYGNDLLDINDAKKRSKEDVADIFNRVFPLDATIYDVQVITTIPTTDAYGQTTQKMLINIVWTKDTYNKVNFDSFDSDNMKVVSDIYTENNSIK